MFDREEVTEKFMECMSKEFILKNVRLTLENLEAYKPKSSYVPTDDRFTGNMKGVAVVPYLPIMEDSDGRATAVVTYDMLDNYEISVKDMFEAAYRNMDKEPVRIRALTDVIMSMTLEGIVGDGEARCFKPEELKRGVGELYYVTNSSAYKGAMCLFSKDTYKRIGEAIGEYYAIPSSIHEFLIVSSDGIEPGFIADMVKSVNASGIVAEHDILSDEVYKFDADSGNMVTVKLNAEKDAAQEADLER